MKLPIIAIAVGVLSFAGCGKPAASVSVATVLPEVYGFYIRDGTRLVRLDAPTENLNPSGDDYFRVSSKSTLIVFAPELRTSGISDAGKILKLTKRVFVRANVSILRSGRDGPIMDYRISSGSGLGPGPKDAVFDIRPIPSQTEMVELIPREGGLSGIYDLQYGKVKHTLAFDERTPPMTSDNLTGEYFDIWGDVDMREEKPDTTQNPRPYAARYELGAKLEKHVLDRRKEAMQAFNSGKLLDATELLRTAEIPMRQSENAGEWKRIVSAWRERAESALKIGDYALAVVYAERALTNDDDGNMLDAEYSQNVIGKYREAFKKWKALQNEESRAKKAELSTVGNTVLSVKGAGIEPDPNDSSSRKLLSCEHRITENAFQVFSSGTHKAVSDVYFLHKIQPVPAIGMDEKGIDLPGQSIFARSKQFPMVRFNYEGVGSVDVLFDYSQAQEKFYKAFDEAYQRALNRSLAAGTFGTIDVAATATGLELSVVANSSAQTEWTPAFTVPCAVKRVILRYSPRAALRFMVDGEGPPYASLEDWKPIKGQNIRFQEASYEGGKVAMIKVILVVE